MQIVTRTVPETEDRQCVWACSDEVCGFGREDEVERLAGLRPSPLGLWL